MPRSCRIVRALWLAGAAFLIGARTIAVAQTPAQVEFRGSDILLPKGGSHPT